MSNKKEWKQTTIAAQAGIDKDTAHGSVSPPLYLSTNYAFEEYNQQRQYDYSRSGNPTRENLENVLADLEGGAGGIVTSTGMSALHLICLLLKPDDLIIAPHDCYGGTYRLLTSCAKQGHFKLKRLNLTDEKSLAQISIEKPAMILIETPSNPLLRITDIKKIVQQAKLVGALVAVDNTFMSPVLQNPIALGADIVVHSTTKYLNGHGDVVAGAVIAKTKELHEELALWAKCTGIVGSPFDSFLTLRGIRTLVPRIKQQTESAEKIVDFLKNHPSVAHVNYPGLTSHQGHEIAKTQQNGFGAMISFELNGNIDNVKSFLNNITSESQLFSLAASLGGFESLVSHPATMGHATMGEEVRKTAGISDTLIRLSIGLEDVDDLLKSLDTAFN